MPTRPSASALTPRWSVRLLGDAVKEQTGLRYTSDATGRWACPGLDFRPVSASLAHFRLRQRGAWVSTSGLAKGLEFCAGRKTNCGVASAKEAASLGKRLSPWGRRLICVLQELLIGRFCPRPRKKEGRGRGRCSRVDRSRPPVAAEGRVRDSGQRPSPVLKVRLRRCLPSRCLVKWYKSSAAQNVTMEPAVLVAWRGVLTE